MSSDHHDPGASPQGRRPPTIDLTAKEVGSPKPAGGSPDSAQGEPKREPKASDSSSAPRPSGAAPRERQGLWTAFVGAVIGAGVVLVIGGAAWRYGFKPQQGTDPVLSARLARIEAQIHDMTRPAAPADMKSLNDIAARLAKIEATLAAQAPSSEPAPASNATANGEAAGVAGEIASLRLRLDEMAAQIRNAQRRADDAASTADAAQKSSQSTTAELARAAQPDDRASRVAVAATALRAAVDRGEPFTAELAAAKALLPDTAGLAPLEPFAVSGIVSQSALAHELTALVPALLKANSALSSDSSFLGKLQANAERIVRVRPIGDAAGSDPASTIARIENKAGQSDIDGVLGEFAKLPASVRAPAEGWIKKAEQRKSAIVASRQFARDALAALGKPSL